MLRLPNVFTAMADVVMGFLFTHASLSPQDASLFTALVFASSALYLGGTVLNDVFDIEVDRIERPQRPLPSGRISLGAAKRLGWGLLVIGVALAWVAAGMGRDWSPGCVGVVLATCVVLYDACLKQTLLGPLGMGACRFLNVLLGMSLASTPWQDQHWLVAAAIGTYIVGVTWFARTEAARSDRAHLVMATVVLLAGVGLLAWVPGITEDAFPQLRRDPQTWALLIIILSLLNARRCSRAIVDPSPRQVQIAVRQLLFSLVILDAAVCFVVWGTSGAIAILLFLIPALVLGRKVYST